MGGDTYENSNYQKDNTKAGTLDRSWYNGYKNDIWITNGGNWEVQGDIRTKNTYHDQKQPQVFSTMKWSKIQSGLLPKVGQTYDNWIICAEFFNTRQYEQQRMQQHCDQIENQQLQWSPRRHHTSVFFNGLLWIFGGRTRELINLSNIRTIGGIIGPKVGDIRNNPNQKFTTQREASIARNDVWNSPDGIHWTLVTPGS